MSFARALLRLSGAATVLLPWLSIASSMAVNRWFNPLEGAFSDLGSATVIDPWIFNYGLVISALFVAAFSLALMRMSRNRLETAGGAFLLVAALFLAMIGIFHEGTYPHDFVSYWFFVQADLAVGAIGAGRVLARERGKGSFLIAWSFAWPLVATLVTWPSTATLEAFGIASLDVAVLVLILSRKNEFTVEYNWFSRLGKNCEARGSALTLVVMWKQGSIDHCSSLLGLP
ncbi:DUF998 domain-containing protein [Tardisphaera saccharovorans]